MTRGNDSMIKCECGQMRRKGWPCECAVLKREQVEIKASKKAGRRID